MITVVIVTFIWSIVCVGEVKLCLLITLCLLIHLASQNFLTLTSAALFFTSLIHIHLFVLVRIPYDLSHRVTHSLFTPKHFSESKLVICVVKVVSNSFQNVTNKNAVILCTAAVLGVCFIIEEHLCYHTVIHLSMCVCICTTLRQNLHRILDH